MEMGHFLYFAMGNVWGEEFFESFRMHYSSILLEKMKSIPYIHFIVAANIYTYGYTKYRWLATLIFYYIYKIVRSVIGFGLRAYFVCCCFSCLSFFDHKIYALCAPTSVYTLLRTNKWIFLPINWIIIVLNVICLWAFIEFMRCLKHRP